MRVFHKLKIVLHLIMDNENGSGCESSATCILAVLALVALGAMTILYLGIALAVFSYMYLYLRGEAPW